MSGDIRSQIICFFVYVVLYLLLFNRIVVFESAFGVFYLGYLLFQPAHQDKMTTMTIAFLVGLLIDMFSNTPGIHAFACVFLVALRMPWLTFVRSSPEVSVRLNIHQLGLGNFLLFCFPLVLVHHSFIFFIENGALTPFWTMFKIIFTSALFSTLLITLTDYLLTKQTGT